MYQRQHGRECAMLHETSKRISFVYTNHYFKIIYMDLLAFGLLNSVYKQNGALILVIVFLLELHAFSVFSEKVHILSGRYNCKFLRKAY